MPDNDKMMRAHASQTPLPEFLDPAFTKPPALCDARVAIVTSAALHVAADDGFTPNSDPKFSILEAGERSLRLGHFSPNFDRGGFAADLNVVSPIDRLHELVDRGTIGSVAARHYSFAGNQNDTVSAIRLDTGPEVAKRLLDDKVDIVLLTPGTGRICLIRNVVVRTLLIGRAERAAYSSYPPSSSRTMQGDD